MKEENKENIKLCKEFILAWLDIQKMRLLENNCDDEDVCKVSEIVRNELDSKMSRDNAIKYFGVKEKTFDSAIHRKMPSRDIKRNIVSYSFSLLFDIFKRNKD